MKNSRSSSSGPPAPPLNEHALAGAILSRPAEAMAIAAAEGVSSASFTDHLCAAIYSAAASLIQAGRPADMVTILDAADATDHAAEAAAFVDACRTIEFATHYARAVKAEQNRRDLRSSALAAIESADSGAEVASILTNLRTSLESIEDQSRIAPIVPATDFAAEAIPEPPQVIHDVIRAGQVGMMAASSKAGKSWALLALAMSVATGSDWMGWQTTKGRVLYINAELSKYDMQRRLKELAFALGLPGVPAGLDVWHVRGDTKTIKTIIPEIMRRQRHTGQYGIILPDPLYSFNGGKDENDNTAQAEVMGWLSELAERSGAAVWVAHHFSKGNKRDVDHLDRASGAGMFARAVDTFCTFTRHAEDQAYSVEVTTRSFSKPEKFAVRWEYPLWVKAPDLDPEELKKPSKSGRKSKYSAEAVAALVPVDGRTHGVLYEAYHMDSGISLRHFNNLVQKCLEEKLLVKRNEKYFTQY